MAAIQDTGSDHHARDAASPHTTTTQTAKNQAQDLQDLDAPLPMSAHFDERCGSWLRLPGGRWGWVSAWIPWCGPAWIPMVR